MSEYLMFTSLDGKKYFDAAIRYQHDPSEQNKKQLDEISSFINKSLDESQQRCENEFIQKYGQDVFEFVKKLSLNKPHFLVGKDNLLRWDVSDDTENEEYEVVRFYKGIFDYARMSYSGYGETVVLEDKLSKERVLELLKMKP